ncbi:hypothetical protein BDQ12DRAFT_637222 [Crucibulum laeve]|uniref:HD/PDEase domain-containing protein n=1 Tax=Crucibulum laeve TaxID=68775 RepID=A0A5C3LLG2_9AGAR|nr:hypothetical protein BDQ12DRAFT_637222 [Crucibulum laeve]
MAPSHHSFDDDIDYPGNNSRSLTRYIKDPIHDYIPASPLLIQFIDSKAFQRLRHVKQLGTSSYVWPGGSHSRFEHSLGVAYLARLMAEHLQTSQPDLGITDRDVNCVEIAGLCHDLGHGPWSHVWDGMFIPAALKDSNWRHEEGSEMMFDYLIKENEIPLPQKDSKFVKALIAGDPSKCSPDEKPFLFDIVANKRNGLDVDKFDYIQRDSHMIGDPITLSLTRIIHSARVLDNQICYDIKDANQIYEICATRFKLHKIIYNHKTAKAVEYMIIDGLLAAQPYMHIAERVHNPETYVHLTDDIMSRIETTTEPELAPARAIFARIHTRDLYKCVDYKVIDWPLRAVFREHITPEHIVEAANALSVGPSTPVTEDDLELKIPAPPLEVKDVIVDFSTMHYGMKEKNPLDYIKFYSKRNPNQSAIAGRGDYSNLMPQYFAEDLIRVYTKKPQYFGLVQAGYRAVLAAMENSAPFPLSPPLDAVLEGDGTTSLKTPPATEPPTTPKAQSRQASFTFLSVGASSTATPFSNNSFTTVSPRYMPTSPTQTAKRTRSVAKRAREEDPESTPMKKSRV